jgi:uncharacterized RDD family membrane protein YckC
MNCWEILGVEPWTDKKTIKSAYARRLKQTRPDDDPQGFRVLHDAYKQALALSEEAIAWEVTEDVPENVTVDFQPPAVAVTVPVAVGLAAEQVEVHLSALSTEPDDLDNVSEVHLSPPADVAFESEALRSVDAEHEQESLTDHWDEDWDDLFTRVNALFSVKNVGTDVTLWAFLESIPSLVDIEFRAGVSDRLFSMVSEANEISLRNKSLFFKPPVLNYFNRLFAWDSKWQEYSQIFSKAQLDAVLPYLDGGAGAAGNKRKRTAIKPSELHYYPRIGAFLIDAVILGVFLFVLSGALAACVVRGVLTEEMLSMVQWGSGILYFWLIIPLLEASSWQASIGKRLLGLKVVNGQGMRMSWYHAIGRGVIASCCVVGIKIVLWINLVLGRYKNMLLQDWLSRSYVIEE